MGSHEPMSLQLPNIYGGLRQYNPLSGVINGHREEAQTTSASNPQAVSRWWGRVGRAGRPDKQNPGHLTRGDAAGRILVLAPESRPNWWMQGMIYTPATSPEGC